MNFSFEVYSYLFDILILEFLHKFLKMIVQLIILKNVWDYYFLKLFHLNLLDYFSFTSSLYYRPNLFKVLSRFRRSNFKLKLICLKNES